MAQMGKNMLAMQETQLQSLSWEDPLEEGMVTTPEFLPGESHGQRSLVGYSIQGQKESDMTQWLTLHFFTVPFSSVAQSCLILCDPMDCSTPGFPVYHQLPELTQTLVH